MWLLGIICYYLEISLCTTISRSLMKMLNKTGPSTDHLHPEKWGLDLVESFLKVILYPVGIIYFIWKICKAGFPFTKPLCIPCQLISKPCWFHSGLSGAHRFSAGSFSWPKRFPNSRFSYSLSGLCYSQIGVTAFHLNRYAIYIIVHW